MLSRHGFMYSVLFFLPRTCGRIVAKIKAKKIEERNKFLNLPLYYAGQKSD